VPALETGRLRLRQWRDADLAPFAALNADPEVMRHFPAPLDRSASDALARRCRDTIAERGWGLWAVEIVPGVGVGRDGDVGDPGGAGDVDAGAFIGFVGLAEPRFDAHFTPAVEVGWRLAQRFWGRGFATEAATAALVYAFGELTLDEVVSFTTVANDRSRRVMQRLGMHRDPADDFDHPSLAVADPIRPHVLYRLRREEFSVD
jgi:RimJ/RimL family protein N-acetyltransferase